jgi:hypothetical protein
MHVYHEANQQAFEYFASQVHQTRQQQPEQQQQQQPKQSEQQLVDNTNAVAAALPTCSSGGSVSLPLQPELPAPTPPATTLEPSNALTPPVVRADCSSYSFVPLAWICSKTLSSIEYRSAVETYVHTRHPLDRYVLESNVHIAAVFADLNTNVLASIPNEGTRLLAATTMLCTHVPAIVVQVYALFIDQARRHHGIAGHRTCN